MPRIFNTIDAQMKNCFEGKRTEELGLGIPPGVVNFGEKWVESIPTKNPGYDSTCFVRGRFDSAIRFDDGSYGVIDFKTSIITERSKRLYARQLHAYAYALENPAPGKLALNPISKIGLIAFGPTAFLNEQRDSASLVGNLTWMEIRIHRPRFLEFLGEVMSILELEESPSANNDCPYCRYRGSDFK